MRVLLLVQQPVRRGAEVFAADLSNFLVKAGHEVRLVYLYGEDESAGPDSDVRPVLLGGDPSRLTERAPGVDPMLLRRLANEIRAFRPDIVQANGARTLKYAAVAHVLNRARFELIYRSIGDPTVWLVGTLKRFLYRNLFMSRVSAIAAVSENTERSLRAVYRLDGSIVRVIPRGVDLGRLAPRRDRTSVRSSMGVDDLTPVVLYVGSIAAEKRPDRLARVVAMAHASHPSLRLWVVGDGPMRPQLEECLEQAGIRECVTFVGRTDDVGSFLGAATVLALTSDTEGLPGVVLEAAALGLPVVTTNVGGVSDAVDDCVTGRLIPVEDESGFADALSEVIADPDRSARIAEAAEELFHRKFSMEIVGAGYLDLYAAVRR